MYASKFKKSAMRYALYGIVGVISLLVINLLPSETALAECAKVNANPQPTGSYSAAGIDPC